jgi:hypothetical protein
MESKARVAGILSIIAGACGIIRAAFIIFCIVYFFNMISGFTETFPPDEQFSVLALLVIFKILFFVVCSVFIIMGVLCILGGFFALKRKRWGLALTGAIASVLTFMPCGIVALIFISPARDEFSSQETSTS